ncbi:hypothetical protein AKJ09_07821 [Labilithrix luteola]|uniref:Uncharacterized protein n=1 Tax=Labilithrix luteola TaxID=1391654 RepID=A0A0K1Q5Z4_9BACT|nr:hypothetical protein [Labilithrix luteola]AKV01158.1 hypothetical protein AKJ09_07821 [Labilithrix luteola]
MTRRDHRSHEPDYLLLFSSHLPDDSMPKPRAAGFNGGLIVPLPESRIVT